MSKEVENLELFHEGAIWTDSLSIIRDSAGIDRIEVDTNDGMIIDRRNAVDLIKDLIHRFNINSDEVYLGNVTIDIDCLNEIVTYGKMPVQELGILFFPSIPYTGKKVDVIDDELTHDW